MKKENRRIAIILVLAIVAVTVAAIMSVTHTTANPTPATGELSRDIYFWLKDHMTYASIVVLMAMESSIIPLPSEVVVPPAAYFALQQNSELNIYMVILMATIGAFLGSIINYAASVLLGRPIIYAFAESRLGRLLRLSREKLEHAEQFFQKRGNTSIFVARLLPVVRHLISIPAGLSRMNLGSFCLYTTLGAGLWNIVLALMGYLLYLAVPDDNLFFDQLEHYSRYMKIAGFVPLGGVVIYLIYKYSRRKPAQ